MIAIRAGCSALCALVIVAAASAQTYPAKPVRLVVPYPPGGSNDVLSRINYGSTGTGGHNHLATELFRRMAGIRIVHVPYKGVAPALTDLMGGHTQLVMTSLPSALTQVQAGRLKALAVGSEKRSSFMPEMPTISESGVPGYFAEFWWGIAAPSRTPGDIVDRLASALTRALQSAELRQRFATEGAEPSIMTREQFGRFVANEITRWRKVALEADIKPE